MPNRFTDSFSPYGNSMPQQNGNLLSQWGEFQSNPSQFLANKGINVPQEYQNNPEAMAKYLLGNMPGQQQNFIMQKVNMLKGMFGFR